MQDQESKQLKDEEQEADAEDMRRYDKAIVTEKKKLHGKVPDFKEVKEDQVKDDLKATLAMQHHYFMRCIIT